MMSNLIDALPGLGFVGLAVGAVAVARLVFGDRSGASEHDLSDYHEPAAPMPPRSRRVVTVKVRSRATRREPLPLPFEWDGPDDILPPAPPGMNAGSPLYAGMLFDTWHPEDADAVAARWLRELGEQARTAVAR